jgi:hypothetical protein
MGTEAREKDSPTGRMKGCVRPAHQLGSRQAHPQIQACFRYLTRNVPSRCSPPKSTSYFPETRLPFTFPLSNQRGCLTFCSRGAPFRIHVFPKHLWTVIPTREVVVPHGHIEFLSGGETIHANQEKGGPITAWRKHSEALFAANNVNG